MAAAKRRPLVKAPRDPARRRRILVAAKKHFIARGFKGANLDEIARDARCAQGALYLEFADKRALIREVIDEAAEAAYARYRSEVASLPSPLERIVAGLTFSFREYHADPLFTRIVAEDPELADIGMDPKWLAEGKRFAVEMAKWVDEAVACGEIRSDIDRAAVPFVLGVLKHAPQHLRILQEHKIFSERRALDAIVDVFRAGLAAQRPRRRRESR